ncbi:UNKNOWN [Stylonychia lemnae]|uniref:Transmembrane protein n=1 Tax=Stylonychia lemnae TaxID=5949 RepID=A0A078AHS9_STYLE|nr:UNKNOWN [Stylonychia lemnae]|eukprot:CDW81436.1 UNKNOWN [Stylonychia lemnae]
MGDDSMTKMAFKYQQVMMNFQKMDLLNNQMQDQKDQAIKMSKVSKQNMFTMQNLEQYQARIEQDEKLKEQTLSASDSIDYYNRKYYQKKDLNQMLKIPGCFFKVRAQGGASSKDIEEINKFYKRTFVTLFAVVFHSYLGTTFLYESRILSKKRTPNVYHYLPWCVYPLGILGCIVYMYSQNKLIMERLDRKYTPIWLDISKKL